MPYAEATFKKTGAATNLRTARKNPRELVIALHDEDPTASWHRLYQDWRKRILADDDYLEAVLSYAYSNYTTAIDKDNAAPRKRKRNRHDIAAEKIAISQFIHTIKKVVLMDLTLPTGKTLRKSTFRECSLAGGWFRLIALKGKPSEVVGDKLTEDDLRRIGKP